MDDPSRRVLRMEAHEPSKVRWSEGHEGMKLVPLENVPGAFLIEDALSFEECAQFIKATETLGYGEALITTPMGMVAMPDVRDNYRLMWEVNTSMLNPIWNRIKELVPQTLHGGSAVPSWQVCDQGLNERLRFYRYDVGESFKPHYDGHYARNANCKSHLTLIIYLNDDFEGGETTFYIDPVNSKGVRSYSVKIENKAIIKVKPKTGTALLFMHTGNLSPLHEGATPTAGRKYVLRSDIMYNRIV